MKVTYHRVDDMFRTAEPHLCHGGVALREAGRKRQATAVDGRAAGNDMTRGRVGDAPKAARGERGRPRLATETLETCLCTQGESADERSRRGEQRDGRCSLREVRAMDHA